MATCHDMKKGEIYGCDVCGIELQVVKDCKDQGQETCTAHGDEGDDCSFSCCGEELKKKN